ncbi:replicative DNA helicase [Streptomyces sp. NPDC085596]|uniref:replicative DNA helicase n=1 Tax=Streptomyces sp. NPDC085596 TaxID=3365731 RepID=UPI0037D48948
MYTSDQSKDAGDAIAHDLRAEKAVLRAVLNSSDAIADIVEILAQDDFYQPEHGALYSAVLELYARGKNTDITAVMAFLTEQNRLDAAGGSTYLHELAQGKAPKSSWTRNAERVSSTALLRRLRQATIRIDNLASEMGPDSASRIANAAENEIFAATFRSGLPPAHTIGEIIEGTLDDLEAVTRPGAALGLLTGFTNLDALTGGLMGGALTVIAGRPAMGKTTLALDFLRSATLKHNVPAALFTRESGRREISMRILSAEARVALQHMRSGSMTDEDWTRLARRLPQVSAAPLYIQDSAYATFTDLRAQARRLHAQRDVRLIVVDAMHMLDYGTRPFASRYEEISEIARCLKLLAKELEVPVVVVSQLNRGPEQREDKKPMLSDLRDSGALEDNADLVILIHREDAYEKESPRAGEADFIVAKHRDGPTATITVAHQGHYSRFVDMAQT